MAVFVVAPQCPSNGWWTDPWPSGAVVDLLDSLIKVLPVDTVRIYITGLSMGGYATWYLITRQPNRFAAAVPMSGGGDSTQVKRLMKVPIWDFHGDADPTVPVSQSRDMMQAFELVGRRVVYTHCYKGTCNTNPDSVMDSAIDDNATLLYTEYLGGGHTIWNQSYVLPQLHEWVFAQYLNKPTAVSTKKVQAISNRFSLLQNYPNPFNPSTNITYSITKHSIVSLKIYDILGREIATLVHQEQEPGTYNIIFDASHYMSGIYFLRLSMGNNSITKEIILMK